MQGLHSGHADESPLPGLSLPLPEPWESASAAHWRVNSVLRLSSCTGRRLLFCCPLTLNPARPSISQKQVFVSLQPCTHPIAGRTHLRCPQLHSCSCPGCGAAFAPPSRACLPLPRRIWPGSLSPMTPELCALMRIFTSTCLLPQPQPPSRSDC